MNDHYPDSGWCRQERLSVMEMPHGAGGITTKVWRWSVDPDLDRFKVW
ncbi:MULTISPECIES: hypothetical protein [unclassified Pseudomonas]|nr:MULTISPECIES: hypothetical protein [unclassified Pseudomonas]